jgi:adenine-specific DNA methylase
VGLDAALAVLVPGGDLFSPRQALALTTLAQLVREAGERLMSGLSIPIGAETASVWRKGTSVPDERSRGTNEGLRGAKQPWFVPSNAASATGVASPRAPQAPSGRRNGVLSGLSPDSEGAGNGSGEVDSGLADATVTVLALALSRLTDISNALCRWKPSMDQAIALFGRQAIGMTWDFAETSPVSGGAAGDLAVTVGNMLRVLGEVAGQGDQTGHIEQASATKHPLPDDAAAAFVTDPPYYDSVAYAYLSDFFYVWMRRTIADVHPTLFREIAVPKDAEIRRCPSRS